MEGRRRNPAGGRPLAAHGARQGEPAAGTARRSRAARRACSRAAAEPPVIVVCAPDQELPPLPDWVEVVRDPEPGPRAARRARRRARRRGPARRRSRRSAPSTRRSPTRPCMAALLGALGTAPAVVPLATTGRSRSSPSTAPSWRSSRRRSSPTASGGRRRSASAPGRALVEPFELLVVDDVAAFDPGLASFLSFDDAGRLRRRARRCRSRS